MCTHACPRDQSLSTLRIHIAHERARAEEKGRVQPQNVATNATLTTRLMSNGYSTLMIDQPTVAMTIVPHKRLRLTLQGRSMVITCTCMANSLILRDIQLCAFMSGHCATTWGVPSTLHAGHDLRAVNIRAVCEHLPMPRDVLISAGLCTHITTSDNVEIYCFSIIFNPPL